MNFGFSFFFSYLFLKKKVAKIQENLTLQPTQPSHPRKIFGPRTFRFMRNFGELALIKACQVWRLVHTWREIQPVSICWANLGKGNRLNFSSLVTFFVFFFCGSLSIIIYNPQKNNMKNSKFKRCPTQNRFFVMMQQHHVVVWFCWLT